MNSEIYKNLVANINRLSAIEDRLFNLASCSGNLGFESLGKKLDNEVRAIHNIREEFRAITNELAAEHAKR